MKDFALQFSCNVRVVFITSLIVFCTACTFFNDANKESQLYTQQSALATGIDFENQLVFDKNFNIYKYRNYYNGGGVAIGDINNDGLADIYFTANSLPNKLYLNKGNFTFEDITDKAGVAGSKKWSTGVTMADINGDGWLDIYVCNSGDIAGDDKENELFINQRNGTFLEEAVKRGLADKGYSTHAVFFDYDKDNDLDCYLLNNSFKSINSFNKRNNLREKRDSLGGHKLFQNNNGVYTDVSAQAGILGSVIAFGLGVQVGDIDRDGWEDIYVSNDFFERDYLYFNQHNGTFKEDLPARMRHISAASMGADLADINNDAWPDLFATDMLPRDERRLKTKTTFDSWNNYRYEGVDNGYWHQFTRNMLQVNNGDATFSELACFAGIQATDWSWGALIYDMDQDGHKDLFVSNGIYGDLTDQDYIQFISDEKTKQSIVTNEGVDYKKLVEIIPSEPLACYAYHNNGNLTFTDLAKDWGLGEKGFNNGSAYGDLDNDGDLDLVVNRVNMPCAVYKNNAERLLPNNHWIQFELKGIGQNPFAYGTKITAKAKNDLFFVENLPTRGFQSSIDQRPHLGLGSHATLDTVWVEWPDNSVTVLTNVKTNQLLKLDFNTQQHIQNAKAARYVATPFVQLKNINTQLGALSTWRHKENVFSDFDNERLSYLMRSADGPKMAFGDVNGDKLPDVYIGGARFQAGSLWLQKADGTFAASKQSAFLADSICEDSEALFFDLDKDGDQDLYVGSGGTEAFPGSRSLGDRIYLNTKGTFTRIENALPPGKPFATSCVDASDFDGDGDLDLAVGMRLRPGMYGLPVSGYILQNQGNGEFRNITPEIAPVLHNIGMICDLVWQDVNNDKQPDLVVCGEFMPITILINKKGKFAPLDSNAIAGKSGGWWNCITPADLDGDGDQDFILGNYGLNSRFHASANEPLSLWYNDFDENGMAEPVMTMYNEGQSYPIALRHDLVSQLPFLKKKYIRYDKYALQSIEQIFSPDILKPARRFDAYTLESSILWNDGNNKFSLAALPAQAQWSPIFSTAVHDVNGDGLLDILCGGNFSYAKPEIGSTDANYGLILQNLGKRNFVSRNYLETGFFLQGDVRDIQVLNSKNGARIFVGANNNMLQVFQ